MHRLSGMVKTVVAYKKKLKNLDGTLEVSFLKIENKIGICKRKAMYYVLYMTPPPRPHSGVAHWVYWHW